MSIASDLEKVKRLHLDQPQAKILTIDIETAPNLAYVWGIWDQNIPINMLKEVSSVICFAAKWRGQDEVLFFSDYTDGHEAMIESAWDLYNEADIVITYNGDPFDTKNLNREFALAELGPPSPFKSVDLLKVVKKYFKFLSNKLDFVAQQFGVGAKESHTGFQLWYDCIAGDPVAKALAWELMERYNKQDVVITEGLHDKVLPWINNYPVVYPIVDIDDMICVKDGSDRLVKTGTVSVGLYEYDRYICEDCGSWYRSNNSKRVSNVRGV